MTKDVSMTKKERVLATIKGEQTDRIPYSAYVHSTVHERTVERFTSFTLDFYSKYDPDYIKVMYDENYDTPVNLQFVNSVEVWRQLEEFDPHIGAFGRQIEILKRIREAVGAEVPVIQTVFSAFHIGYRLAGRRILEDWKKDPEGVSQGLSTIASNHVRFAECCLSESGIDGFFFGAYGCEEDWMGEEQYREMVMPTDLVMMKGLRKAQILILHIHGEKKTYFDSLKDYSCDAISWEDRLAGPSITEARSKTDKCLVGGIDHYMALKCSPDDIVRQGKEAVAAAAGRKLILAPGCTFFNETPPQNILAVKRAASF
jgi:uroporphyrinogen decarboxylase